VANSRKLTRERPFSGIISKREVLKRVAGCHHTEKVGKVRGAKEDVREPLLSRHNAEPCRPAAFGSKQQLRKREPVMQSKVPGAMRERAAGKEGERDSSTGKGLQRGKESGCGDDCCLPYLRGDNDERGTDTTSCVPEQHQQARKLVWKET